MDLPRDLLRTLVAAVDHGTLDRAATALAITPSAVSQRIRALESRVGRVVLTRQKPVQPTPDGVALLRLARQLELLEHEALAELGAVGVGRSRVRLGVNADSLGTWFLHAVAAITTAHQVEIELHREDQEHTARLLERGIVMGAVTAQRTPVAGCVASPLGSIRYRAACSVEFAERWFPGGVSAGALAAAPMIDFDDADDMQRRYLRSQRVDAAPPRHVISASSEFATAVELGIGWGMLMPSQLDAALGRGTIVELGGDPVDVPLYWQRWNLSSELLTAITGAVVAAAAGASDIVPVAARAKRSTPPVPRAIPARREAPSRSAGR